MFKKDYSQSYSPYKKLIFFLTITRVVTAISCRPLLISFICLLFFRFVFFSSFYLFIYLFFEQGKFDNAVEILKPARYKVVTIGGSNAQVSRKSL